MRFLKSISSNNISASSFDIVYEWEFIISNILNIKVVKQSKIIDWFFRQIEYRLNARDLFNFLLPSASLSLIFIMGAGTQKKCRLNKNSIPIIIDFWLNKNQLDLFYANFQFCPLVLITSAEVYNFLVENKCPLNIAHWPLSLPDNLKITESTKFNKKWDLVLIGRTNPFFLELLRIYSEKHPEFEYVLGSNDIDNRFFYTNKGANAGHAIGRDAYLRMLRSARIAFYTTPGLDLAKKETSFFNQVTPRLLELISGGCNVIAHYPVNADTIYYELDTFLKNVDNYSEFEKQMNLFRITNPPMKNYSEYLNKHYTSRRVELLKEILIKNDIKF